MKNELTPAQEAVIKRKYEAADEAAWYMPPEERAQMFRDLEVEVEDFIKRCKETNAHQDP
jgi:hypothetical protein